ncbi:hypothetical protein ACWD5B_40440, partial [Streptomyces tanashiensis]
EDTARKWAKKVVRDHDEIAVEDFRPKFLVRWVDPPLPVELRQVAGRHGTAAFVRVRSEG